MIIANIATYPVRAEILPDAVSRISPQVDELNVVLNEYQEIPAWMSGFKNVNPVIPDADLKDIGKFLPRPAADSTVFLMDDDLLYPDDYVGRMQDEGQAAGIFDGAGAIGGLHGTSYRHIMQNFRFRTFVGAVIRRNLRVGSLRKTWCFWDALNYPVRVDQIGTGTAVLPGHLLPNFDFMRDGMRRADVRMARWAFENDVPIVALPREHSWLTAVEQDETIYSSFTSKLPRHLSEEISQFAFKIEGSGKPWMP